MKFSLFLARMVLGAVGVGLLLASAIMLTASVFGSERCLLGLGLHLVGQACYLASLCLPGWRRARMGATLKPRKASLASLSSGIRPARFRPEVQIVRLAYGIVAAALLLGWLVFGAWHLRNLLHLRQHGVAGTATITGTTFREAGSLLTVTYAFPTPRGLPVTDTFRASRQRLPFLRTGNLLPVIWLPSDPDIHTLQKVDNGLAVRQCASGVLLTMILLAYLGGPVLWIEGRLRRQLQLARVGVGVTGSIVTCRPLVWRKARRGYLLTYAFATPERHVFIARALVPYLPDEPTLPGFPLTILYDPRQPGISLPLASFHVVEIANARKAVLAA